MDGFELKKKFIMAALAGLLVADAALAFLNLRLSGPRGNREAELTTRTREIGLVKADIKRVTEIKKNIPVTLETFNNFEANTLLPAAKGYSVIAQEMDQFARESHLALDGVRYHEKDVPGRDWTELKMEAIVSGDYSGVVHFLNHLQRAKNVYIVDDLGVETDASNKGPGAPLRINLHLRTYFRKA
jgi:hypothetical protein